MCSQCAVLGDGPHSAWTDASLRTQRAGCEAPLVWHLGIVLSVVASHRRDKQMDLASSNVNTTLKELLFMILELAMLPHPQDRVKGYIGKYLYITQCCSRTILRSTTRDAQKGKALNATTYLPHAWKLYAYLDIVTELDIDKVSHWDIIRILSDWRI